MNICHLFGLLCLLAATVLLIVVSVSTPIWESVYFLKADIVGGGSSTNGLIKLGQWGYCVGSACSKSKLGYDLDAITTATDGQVSASIVHGLTYALVLNPIAAGFSFIALLFALCSNLALGIIASVLSGWAFLVTIIALALDLGLFVTARHRLNDASDNINASFGNALWLVVAAAACQLVAAFTVCFTHSSSKRQRRRDVETRGLTTGEPATGRRGWFGRGSNTNAYGDNTAAGAPVMTEKRHFWQRNKAANTY
ncbi:SUR7/PalI family-domain-containing protein [Leucosporidium creatinivorum]|uniref:SUR7/PalI family-domain-containing protein n=1 Tax=Leucosporidium creatinivorum TaxID=106004 RepID=A0A1Y2DC10_9BASI|nr:SUR7/PalI family-domain-containing protein [Leucosporidium creatinivorum]